MKRKDLTSDIQYAIIVLYKMR